MAYGTLAVDTLNSSTGVLASQNGMTGIAKAWVNFVGSSSPTINSSFNVSSITYNSVGNYKINFSTSMPDTNYATLASSWHSVSNSNCTQNINTGASNAAGIQVEFYENSVSTNPNQGYVAVFR